MCHGGTAQLDPSATCEPISLRSPLTKTKIRTKTPTKPSVCVMSLFHVCFVVYTARICNTARTGKHRLISGCLQDYPSCPCHRFPSSSVFQMVSSSGQHLHDDLRTSEYLYKYRCPMSPLETLSPVNTIWFSTLCRITLDQTATQDVADNSNGLHSRDKPIVYGLSTVSSIPSQAALRTSFLANILSQI